MILPLQTECTQFYGRPGPEVEARLTSAPIPFSMRLDWDRATTTNRLRVHQKCAPALTAALTAVHKQYGLPRMQQLGLDLYGGGFALRKMRGGTKWSMHAYGCAIDLNPGPNGLKVRCPDALFCKPEYADFLDIMEEHGWLSALRMWGADAMHFQMARLK